MTEIAEVQRLLAGTRLLTVTGAGGCGKSRLVLEAARELGEEFPDDIGWVELASLSDPSLVPQAVARLFEVREKPGETLTQTLVRALKEKHRLLVLDNCEHLLEAVATLVHDLLRGCPRVRVIATSREALNVLGETPYRVPPLTFPETDPLPGRWEEIRSYEAVRLFVERAATVLPSFDLTEEKAPWVAWICRRLDGIPLAIELAAVRVKALSVEMLAKRLDDRFSLLAGGNRTGLPRHRTLRACMEWSYELLAEAEKALLRRLSVFAGGWTLEAAEAACAGAESGVRELAPALDRHGESPREVQEQASAVQSGGKPSYSKIRPADVLTLLTALVDKSLVQYEEREPGTREAGGERYRLLETVRQYGRERLEEAGEEERAPPSLRLLPDRGGGRDGRSRRARYR